MLNDILLFVSAPLPPPKKPPYLFCHQRDFVHVPLSVAISNGNIKVLRTSTAQVYHSIYCYCPKTANKINGQIFAFFLCSLNPPLLQQLAVLSAIFSLSLDWMLLLFNSSLCSLFEKIGNSWSWVAECLANSPRWNRSTFIRVYIVLFLAQLQECVVLFGFVDGKYWKMSNTCVKSWPPADLNMVTWRSI